MEYIHGGDSCRYQNVIDFSANINPLGIQLSVKKAVQESIESLTSYPDPYCCKLREALEQFYNIPKDYVICGNGASDLIYRAVFALKPQRAVLISPCFSEYEQALQMTDTDIDYYNVKKKDFLLKEDFLAMLTKEIDIVVLCNPNNPTGTLIEPDLMVQILEKCRQEHIFLLMDECFLEFCKEEKKYSLLPLCKTEKNIFVLRAFTKIYAIPSVRLGYGICSDKKLIEKMYLAGADWNVSGVAQMAGIAALKETEYISQSIKYIQKEREYIYQKLNQLNITFYPSEANYILIKSEINLKEKLLKEHILIRDCSNYKNLERGYYRIAVKKHEENELLISKLEKIMQKYG